MFGFADVRRSSPITAEHPTPDVPSPLTPTTLARAASTASSLRQRLFSPHSFNQLTRRLSLSPLSARNRGAGLRSSNSTSKLGEFSQKMSVPITPETVLQNSESKSPLKKILPFEKKSPEKEETSIFEALAEGSPVPASAKRKTPQKPCRDTFGSITPSELRVGSSTFTPITDEFDKKSKSARSLSSLFKRSGTDNSKSFNSSTLTISRPIDQSIIHPTATTELRRHDLERYLRIVCNSPHVEFHWASMYPRHPNTSNEWKSRNLKCTNCLTNCCAVCGRACCAYRAATLGLENHKDNPHGREEAYQRIVDISAVFPYGKETPTFLECTTCKQMVCPDCCGMCPIDGCGDLECRKCKRPNPWMECDWHFESARCASISTLRSDAAAPVEGSI